jgi:hypothetical protein
MQVLFSLLVPYKIEKGKSRGRNDEEKNKND